MYAKPLKFQHLSVYIYIAIYMNSVHMWFKYPKRKMVKNSFNESTFYRICKTTYCRSESFLNLSVNSLLIFFDCLGESVFDKHWTTFFPCKFLPQKITSTFIKKKNNWFTNLLKVCIWLIADERCMIFLLDMFFKLIKKKRKGGTSHN